MAAKPEEPEIFEILRKIRYDLTAAQAKVTEALNTVAAMNLPVPRAGEHNCRSCDFSFGSERALALHMQNVHGGPPVPLDEHELSA